MDKSWRTISFVLLALALVGGVSVVGVKVWDHLHPSRFDRALSVVPKDTLRLGFTDWRAVRRSTGAKLSAKPTAAQIDTFIQDASDKDYAAVSSIDESAPALAQKFGFSPVNAEWEAYAQSRAGAAMVLRMPDSFDFTALRTRLEKLGYTKPAKDTGVWDGGVDLMPAIDPSISPELQYVVVLADQHLVISSDGPEYAAKTGAVARGKEASLADLKSSVRLVDQVKNPVAAMLWSRDFACEDLAMSQAAPDDQTLADQVIAKAGKVTALSGLVMSMGSDRAVTVIEGFTSAGQAEENLRARARLAVGQAVGRAGDFSDDFRLSSSKAIDSSVVLRLQPKGKSGFSLSELNSGPVIFATC